MPPLDPSSPLLRTPAARYCLNGVKAIHIGIALHEFDLAESHLEKDLEVNANGIYLNDPGKSSSGLILRTSPQRTGGSARLVATRFDEARADVGIYMTGQTFVPNLPSIPNPHRIPPNEPSPLRNLVANLREILIAQLQHTQREQTDTLWTMLYEELGELGPITAALATINAERVIFPTPWSPLCVARHDDPTKVEAIEPTALLAKALAKFGTLVEVYTPNATRQGGCDIAFKPIAIDVEPIDAISRLRLIKAWS